MMILLMIMVMTTMMASILMVRIMTNVNNEQ